MKLVEFLEKTAPGYLTLRNKYGAIDADKYLKDCFKYFYINSREDELTEVVENYINEKYLEDNVLGIVEQYVNNNEVDTKKLEDLIAIMEELI